MANLDWLTGLLHAAGSYYRGRMEGTLAAEARRRQEELDRLNEELVRSQIEQNKANAAYTQVLAQGQGTKNTAAQQALEGVPAERISTENLLRAAYDPAYSALLGRYTGQLGPGSWRAPVRVEGGSIDLGTVAPPPPQAPAPVAAAATEVGALAPPVPQVLAPAEGGAIDIPALLAQFTQAPARTEDGAIDLGTQVSPRAEAPPPSATLAGGAEIGWAPPTAPAAFAPGTVTVTAPVTEFEAMEGPPRLAVTPDELSRTLEALPEDTRRRILRATATEVDYDEYGHPIYYYATPEDRARAQQEAGKAALEMAKTEADIDLTRAQAGATKASAALSSAQAALTRVKEQAERVGLDYAEPIAQAELAVKRLQALSNYIDLIIKATYGAAEAQAQIEQMRANADHLSRQAELLSYAMETGHYPATVSDWGPGRLSVAQQELDLGWARLDLEVRRLAEAVQQFAARYGLDLRLLGIRQQEADTRQQDADTRRMEADTRRMQATTGTAGATGATTQGGVPPFPRPGQGGREAE